MIDRQHLASLLTALDASPRSLRRDACGDWAINGKAGHIFADGSGFALYVKTGESVGRWNNTKRRLAFCRVSQDGDDEGVLRLDRLPTSTEADAIRKALRIKRRRQMTVEALAALERARSSVNRPSGGSGSIESIAPLLP